jgi:hypothetical protein
MPEEKPSSQPDAARIEIHVDNSWEAVECVEVMIVPIDPGRNFTPSLFADLLMTQVEQLIPRFREIGGYQRTCERAASSKEASDIILRKATNKSRCAVIIPGLSMQVPMIGSLSCDLAILTTVPPGKGPQIGLVKNIQAISQSVRVGPVSAGGTSSGCLSVLLVVLGFFPVAYGLIRVLH